MELLLIRHAEPRLTLAENGEAADPALSELGLRQAGALARWLAEENIDELLVSPLRRARETAAPLAETLGLDPVVVPGLAEFDAGASAYIPIEELRRTGDPRLAAMVEGRWGELGVDLDVATFSRCAIETVEEIVAAHPGRRTAAVCHGGVVNVYLGRVLGIDRPFWFEPVYSSISRVLAGRSGARTILSLNETAHLRESRLYSMP